MGLLAWTGEAIAQDAALHVVIEERGDHRVLKAGDHDDFVLKFVVRAAHLAQAGSKLLLLDRVHVVDEEHLEVRARGASRLVAEGIRRGALLVALLGAQLLRVEVTIAIPHQQADHPRRVPRQRAMPTALEEARELLAGSDAGEDPVALDSQQQRERALHRFAQLRRVQPALAATPQAFRQVAQIVPRLRPKLGGGVVVPKLVPGAALRVGGDPGRPLLGRHG
jgi:hypothetical protein